MPKAVLQRARPGQKQGAILKHKSLIGYLKAKYFHGIVFFLLGVTLLIKKTLFIIFLLTGVGLF
jgi:hypothetical protein